MKPTDHGPDCVACQDPKGLPVLLAQTRDRLDADAAIAKQHRTYGEELRRRSLDTSLSNTELAAIQTVMQHHLGTANGILSSVGMMRAQLDRVEQAHLEEKDTP
jgi:hypothetical protein